MEGPVILASEPQKRWERNYSSFSPPLWTSFLGHQVPLIVSWPFILSPSFTRLINILSCSSPPHPLLFLRSYPSLTHILLLTHSSGALLKLSELSYCRRWHLPWMATPQYDAVHPDHSSSGQTLHCEIAQSGPH